MNDMDLARELIRHNSWATCKLIEHLQTLPPGTEELSAEGTYGSIGATMSHLVRTERAYLAHLKGETPQRGARVTSDFANIGLEAQHLARGWNQLLETDLDLAAEVQTIRGPQTKGTILAEVINHGCEHRAHVCTVLGANGLHPPAIDPFAYGEEQKRSRA